MRGGPSSTSTRAASSLTRPSPAFSVSSRCSETSSSSLSAAAIPPCAYCVLDSVTSRLARQSTRPAEGEFHRGAQTGNARANNDEIGFGRKRVHRTSFMVARSCEQDARRGCLAQMQNGNSIRPVRRTVYRSIYTRHLTRIPVQTPSRSYEVLVERGLLRSAAAALARLVPQDARVFVLDRRRPFASTGPSRCRKASAKPGANSNSS